MTDKTKVDMDKTMKLDKIVKFLLGEDAMEGCNFGEKQPWHKGTFWWREHLREAYAHLAREVRVTDANHEPDCNVNMADVRRKMMGCDCAVSMPVAAKVPDAGMLNAALIPHAKEWYRLCELAAYAEKISISGPLAEAIVKALLAQGNSGVRDGWKLVPLKASSEQMMRGYEASCRYGVFEEKAFDLAELMYNEMLASAPNPDDVEGK